VLATEDGTGVGHDLLDIAVSHFGPHPYATPFGDDLGHHPRADAVVEHGRTGVLLEHG
jgi:hypothetical protein